MKSKTKDSSVIDISIDDFILDINDKCKKIRLKYHNKKIIDLFVSSCKYCHKLTFGIKKAKKVCSSKECKRKFRNESENKRHNSPYRKPITSLYNYISSHKAIFRTKVNDNPYWVEKFEVVEHRIKDVVKMEVYRREKAKLPPNDDDMNQFLVENKHEMYSYMNSLLIEYNSINIQ